MATLLLLNDEIKLALLKVIPDVKDSKMSSMSLSHTSVKNRHDLTPTGFFLLRRKYYQGFAHPLMSLSHHMMD